MRVIALIASLAAGSPDLSCSQGIAPADVHSAPKLAVEAEIVDEVQPVDGIIGPVLFKVRQAAMSGQVRLRSSRIPLLNGASLPGRQRLGGCFEVEQVSFHLLEGGQRSRACSRPCRHVFELDPSHRTLPQLRVPRTAYCVLGLRGFIVRLVSAVRLVSFVCLVSFTAALGFAAARLLSVAVFSGRRSGEFTYATLSSGWVPGRAASSSSTLAASTIT